MAGACICAFCSLLSTETGIVCFQIKILLSRSGEYYGIYCFLGLRASCKSQQAGELPFWPLLRWFDSQYTQQLSMFMDYVKACIHCINTYSSAYHLCLVNLVNIIASESKIVARPALYCPTHGSPAWSSTTRSKPFLSVRSLKDTSWPAHIESDTSRRILPHLKESNQQICGNHKSCRLNPLQVMPELIQMITDKFIGAQILLSACHPSMPCP